MRNAGPIASTYAVYLMSTSILSGYRREEEHHAVCLCLRDGLWKSDIYSLENYGFHESLGTFTRGEENSPQKCSTIVRPGTANA